jgi:hypothetical protein
MAIWIAIIGRSPSSDKSPFAPCAVKFHSSLREADASSRSGPPTGHPPRTPGLMSQFGWAAASAQLGNRRTDSRRPQCEGRKLTRAGHTPWQARPRERSESSVGAGSVFASMMDCQPRTQRQTRAGRTISGRSKRAVCRGAKPWLLSSASSGCISYTRSVERIPLSRKSPESIATIGMTYRKER